ncbi:uncharacterized protein [Oncorhynchus clarkii lewisi]|uniref:uncharacterized protein n=1 Tax=Oncorhynchus clarkii lewisi TaxID=490388 RepID=UPI0039B8D9AF
MNQATYKVALEENLLPSALTMFPNSEDWFFQQDNAPCHTARKIKVLVEDHQIKTLSRPAQSPDLNPIENLWNVIERKVDAEVVKYVVQGLQPFTVIEQEPFRVFVQDLQPNSKIISRLTLCSRIDEASKEIKKVTEAMIGVDHIATTTRRWSFIGVTAHWIDPDSLNRCSTALACKRLRGSHTFDVLAGTLNDIHSEFAIRIKIMRATDNGSNFLKAFQVFGEDENNEAVETVGGGEAAQPGQDDGEEEQEEIEEVEFVDVATILNEDDGFEYQLPKYQRCACHLLNLVSTVDALKATCSEAYKKSVLFNIWQVSSTLKQMWNIYTCSRNR